MWGRGKENSPRLTASQLGAETGETEREGKIARERKRQDITM
jgi:hypothetical protein